MTNPTIPITDPRFQYVPAVKTDIRETFKRFAPRPVHYKGVLSKVILSDGKEVWTTQGEEP